MKSVKSLKGTLNFILSGLVLIGFFQNCSGVNFGRNSASSDSLKGNDGEETEGIDDPFYDTEEGLKGGHFDLDTSHQVYSAGMGKTDHHVHEYDDKFGLTYADFFRLKDSRFENINERVGASTEFILVIANAQLSPKGVLSINGVAQSVGDYQTRVRDFISGNRNALTVYSLNGSKGEMLTDLRIGFSADAILNGGLIGTETGCVVRNDPGRLGEYRNGALTLQAIDANSAHFNSETGVADVQGGLIWESTIFYHTERGGCYR